MRIFSRPLLEWEEPEWLRSELDRLYPESWLEYLFRRQWIVSLVVYLILATCLILWRIDLNQPLVFFMVTTITAIVAGQTLSHIIRFLFAFGKSPRITITDKAIVREYKGNSIRLNWNLVRSFSVKEAGNMSVIFFFNTARDIMNVAIPDPETKSKMLVTMSALGKEKSSDTLRKVDIEWTL